MRPRPGARRLGFARPFSLGVVRPTGAARGAECAFDETGALYAISYPSFLRRKVTLVRIGNLKTGQHSFLQAFFHIEMVKTSNQREHQSDIKFIDQGSEAWD